MGDGHCHIKVVYISFIIAVFLAGLTVNGCGKEIKISYDTAHDNVVVESTSGGGLAPLSEDQISYFKLYGDGRVIKRSTDSKTGLAVEGKLEKAEVIRLLEEIKDTGFFGLKNQYINKKVVDAPSSRVIVDLNNYYKVVTVYAMEVEGFKKTVDVIMDFPISGLEDYVPEKGYIFVQSVDPAHLEKDDYQLVAGMLPPATELLSAAGTGKPVEIDGAAFARLKRFESETGNYGIEVIIDGKGYRLYPVYEPSDRC